MPTLRGKLFDLFKGDPELNQPSTDCDHVDFEVWGDLPFRPVPAVWCNACHKQVFLGTALGNMSKAIKELQERCLK